MKLKRLLTRVPLTVYRGNKEIEITGLATHSKRVAPGNLFIAKKGFRDDGSAYIEEAIAAGAVAILSDMGNPFLKEVVQLTHPNIAEVEGKLAAAFYEYPAQELVTIGVTGTNGKTTTCYLIKHLLDALGMPTGLIGTIEYIRAQMRSPAERTTPDVITNHKLLREMRAHQCQAVVMEVSSHALDQGRVNEIDFQIALFTNLTHEHLDYHGTIEAYAAAKAKLFTSLSPHATAIINLESPWAEKMVENCPARIITYGFSPQATLYAHEIFLSAIQSTFKLTLGSETISFSSPLIGRYNILNLLGAIGVLIARGVPLKTLPPLVASFDKVRGRLERVGDHPVFIDYAHTPDGLEKVLRTLQEIKKQRLIVVFGCGGDRDRLKRPLMGAIAQKFADIAIVTSDNPRSEDPMAIIKEIAAGFDKTKPFIEVDRKKAIEQAISIAESTDMVLIAGKGHETTQVYAHKTLPFDDYLVATQALSQQ